MLLKEMSVTHLGIGSQQNENFTHLILNSHSQMSVAGVYELK